MEWEAAALVLSARSFGETSAVVHVLTEEHGRFSGLARGGTSRRQASLWQPGNLVLAQWKARLSDQLGQISAELVQPAAARLLDAPLPLAMLSSVMALTDATLPEREAHPDLFLATIKLVTLIATQPQDPPMAELVRWECALLREIGFGLDLERCTVTGQVGELAYVSPRTGRAVSVEGAGEWRDRLLALPRFLYDESDDGSPPSWVAGMDLTGFFLARHALGAHHVGMPSARERLHARIAALVGVQGV